MVCFQVEACTPGASYDDSRVETSGRVRYTAEVTEAVHMLAQYAIYFGHQSVGQDILGGVQQLAAGSPSDGLKVVESNAAEALGPGVWAHGRLGENKNPESKIADFQRVVESGVGASADAAFFKLCYIDINAETDVRGVFDSYRHVLDALKTKYPQTVFLHVTTPLTRARTGVKAWVKRRIGRPVWGDADNWRRDQFNDLIRETYASEPIFDLARLETTAPDGTVHFVRAGDHDIPALLSQYTTDGGHLNDHGQRHVAARLVELLGRTLAGKTPKHQKRAQAEGVDE